MELQGSCSCLLKVFESMVDKHLPDAETNDCPEAQGKKKKKTNSIFKSF